MKDTNTIVVEQTFNRSIDDVWEAITVREKMIQWFFNNIPSFEPRVGFETRFIIQVEDRVFPHLWKLTEVIPLKKITYDWRYEGYAGSTRVTFELFEDGKQAKLKLTDSLIENFPDHIPEFKRESGSDGWNYFIKKSLKQYLEKQRNKSLR